MLPLLPLPIFICIYLFSWWRCKKNIIADFSSASNNFKLNKLYTTVMIGVTFASFIFLTYGLSSSITTVS